MRSHIFEVHVVDYQALRIRREEGMTYQKIPNRLACILGTRGTMGM